MKVTVLSGGVGGARFLRGVVAVVDPADVTIVGNVGDDIEVLGLHVSPDLDSVLYALAGLADEERGWGRAGETWKRARGRRASSGGDSWFRLGDRDLGLHLVRTAAAARRRAALRGHRAARRGTRPSLHAAAGDRRSRCGRSSRPPPGRSRSRSGSSRAATATRSTPSTTRALRRRRPRPGVLEAIESGRRDRDRAEQPVRLDRPRSWRWRRSAPRSSSGGCPASR